MAPTEVKEPPAARQVRLPVQPSATKSSFSSLSIHPKDEPFSLHGEYLADTHPNKVNLGIGVYRTEDGRPWPLTAIEEAESQLHEERNESRHEYLTIQGDVEFLRLARDLAFSLEDDSKSEHGQKDRADEDRITSIQSVSGTGANRLGAEFLARELKPSTVWIPEPTWSNHHAIWGLARVDIKTYPYYDFEGKCFDYKHTGMTLSAQAQKGDVVVLHACAHNPTGADPSKEQWKNLASLFQTKGLIPFFDLAYQGFASGSLQEDAWAIQYFLHHLPHLEFCAAQSFSKNFGLYGQRAGALHVVSHGGVSASDNIPQAVLSNLGLLARSEYGMAPRAGSDIVKKVLGSKQLREIWYGDLKHMSGRIQAMRQALYDELVRLLTPGSWEHILSQIGMFSYTGLTVDQALAIRERHHVYMLQSGRISLSGLNSKNVRYTARAIDDVVRTVD